MHIDLAETRVFSCFHFHCFSIKRFNPCKTYMNRSISETKNMPYTAKPWRMEWDQCPRCQTRPVCFAGYKPIFHSCCWGQAVSFGASARLETDSSDITNPYDAEVLLGSFFCWSILANVCWWHWEPTHRFWRVHLPKFGTWLEQKTDLLWLSCLVPHSQDVCKLRGTAVSIDLAKLIIQNDAKICHKMVSHVSDTSLSDLSKSRFGKLKMPGEGTALGQMWKPLKNQSWQSKKKPLETLFLITAVDLFICSQLWPHTVHLMLNLIAGWTSPHSIKPEKPVEGSSGEYVTYGQSCGQELHIYDFHLLALCWYPKHKLLNKKHQLWCKVKLRCTLKRRVLSIA